ncbi:V-type proton ATPase subunit d 2 [Bienertia sinuspersici]
MFVLCSWPLLQNEHVDLFLAKAVANGDGIIKLNWCYYVLDVLCSSIAKWHEKKQKLGENPKRVKGCMLLLEITYFHRFVFKGEPTPTQLPLIQHWTNVILNKRLHEESQAEFGTCPLGYETYPICKRKEKMKKQTSNNLLSSLFNTSSVKTSTVGRILQIELPDGMLANEEINAKATDVMRRHVYRSYICAAVVLHETNEVRDDMLKKIESFESNKMNIISTIINHKRKKVEARREKAKQAKAK